MISAYNLKTEEYIEAEEWMRYCYDYTFVEEYIPKYSIGKFPILSIQLKSIPRLDKEFKLKEIQK